MPSFDVVTFGAATQDVFLQSKRFDEVPNPDAPDGVSACVALGAKITVDNITLATGGGATNAAVTLARFGLKTACVSNVGRDLMGDLVIEQLKKERIDVSAIGRDVKEKTGQSIIMLSGAGHRAILNYRGASAHIDHTLATFNKLKTHWLYLTSAAGELSVLKGLFAHAKKHSINIVWNPGQRELALGLKKLLPFLKQTTILLLNREEAGELAELPPRHLSDIVKKLGALPKEVLIITDGQKGAYAYTKDTRHFVPPAKVKRINTTGAGDAFGSAFAAFFIHGHDIVSSLQAGALNAGGVISHMGAKAGILARAPKTDELKRVKIQTSPLQP